VAALFVFFFFSVTEFTMSEYEEQESQLFPFLDSEEEPEDPYYDWDEEEAAALEKEYENHLWENDYDAQVDF